MGETESTPKSPMHLQAYLQNLRVAEYHLSRSLCLDWSIYDVPYILLQEIPMQAHIPTKLMVRPTLETFLMKEIEGVSLS